MTLSPQLKREIDQRVPEFVREGKRRCSEAGLDCNTKQGLATAATAMIECALGQSFDDRSAAYVEAIVRFAMSMHVEMQRRNVQ